MENYSINRKDTVNNFDEMIKYLKYHFDYEIEAGSRTLNGDEIFNIIKDRVPEKKFGQYLKEFILRKKDPELELYGGTENNDTFIKYCFEKFKKNGILDRKNIFKKTGTAMTEELLRKQLKNWFGDVTPSRESVFLLAFALEAGCEGLSELLTKGLCDKGLNYKNPAEVAAYDCLKKGKNYLYAVMILDKAEKKSCGIKIIKKEIYTSEYKKSYDKINSEEKLIEYIAELIAEENDPKFSTTINECYRELLKKISETAVLDKKISVANETGIEISSGNSIAFGTVERYIYYYMPVKNKDGHYKTETYAPYDNGNIAGGKNNTLKNKKWFFSTLLRRTDLRKMYTSEKAITRDTILTLAFFTVCDEEPDSNAYDCICEISDYLNFCGFEQINFSYPYDFFLIMCLQTDDPIACFREVWKKSWKNNNGV